MPSDQLGKDWPDSPSFLVRHARRRLSRSWACRGVTLAAASACVVLAVLTVHVRGANTCLAYRIAHLRERHRQWSEYELGLECQLGRLASPSTLEDSIGQKFRRLKDGIENPKNSDSLAP